MKFSTRWLAMAGCIHDFNVDIHLVSNLMGTRKDPHTYLRCRKCGKTYDLTLSRIGFQAVRQGLL